MENERQCLLDILRAIGKRPGMFLGGVERLSIWDLTSFLAGYEVGRGEKMYPGDDVFYFLTFWVCTRYRVGMGSMNWAGHLWQQSGKDGEAAFRLFFDLLEEYAQDWHRLGGDAIKDLYLQMEKQKREANETFPR